MRKILRVAIVALWLPGLPAFGQWLNVPPLKAPRTKSGAIDLKARPVLQTTEPVSNVLFRRAYLRVVGIENPKTPSVEGPGG